MKSAIPDQKITVLSVDRLSPGAREVVTCSESGEEKARYAVRLRIDTGDEHDGLWGVVEVCVLETIDTHATSYRIIRLSQALDAWDDAGKTWHDVRGEPFKKVVFDMARAAWAACKP